MNLFGSGCLVQTPTRSVISAGCLVNFQRKQTRCPFSFIFCISSTHRRCDGATTIWNGRELGGYFKARQQTVWIFTCHASVFIGVVAAYRLQNKQMKRNHVARNDQTYTNWNPALIHENQPWSWNIRLNMGKIKQILLLLAKCQGAKSSVNINGCCFIGSVPQIRWVDLPLFIRMDTWDDIKRHCLCIIPCKIAFLQDVALAGVSCAIECGIQRYMQCSNQLEFSWAWALARFEIRQIPLVLCWTRNFGTQKSVCPEFWFLQVGFAFDCLSCWQDVCSGTTEKSWSRCEKIVQIPRPFHMQLWFLFFCVLDAVKPKTKISWAVPMDLFFLTVATQNLFHWNVPCFNHFLLMFTTGLSATGSDTRHASWSFVEFCVQCLHFFVFVLRVKPIVPSLCVSKWMKIVEQNDVFSLFEYSASRFGCTCILNYIDGCIQHVRGIMFSPPLHKHLMSLSKTLCDSLCRCMVT